VVAKSLQMFGRRTGQEAQIVKTGSLRIYEDLSSSSARPRETCLLLWFDYPYIQIEYAPPVNIQNKTLHQEHLVNKWLGKYY